MLGAVGKAAAVLLLACASAPAQSDNYREARIWLERMSEAMSELSYQGTFVYVRGEDVETLRITHVNDVKGVRERMVALSGPHREVIRDRRGVRCVLGDTPGSAGAAMVADRLFPEIPVDELSEIRDRYMFTVGGNVRIAGHKGLRVTIYPRDEFRYGYDLWLEAESGMLLRWVLYDPSRRTLAKLMFTELTIGDAVDASELESQTPEEAFVKLETAGDATSAPSPAEPAWAPQGMPPGFRLAARGYRPGGDAFDSNHLVYSDGLASVSVYIEPADASASVPEGLSRLGTANAYSRVAGSRLVTAIGEVPPITVETIGSAFAGVVANVE